MKKILTVLFNVILLLVGLRSFAQASFPSGKIVYAVEMKRPSSFNINITGAEGEAKAASTLTCLFNESAARFIQEPKKEDKPARGMVISAYPSTFYKNSKEKTEYECRQSMGREITIQKDLSSAKVISITDEKKQILGYDCRKAIVEQNGIKAEVYFTTQLPYNHSPKGIFELNGVVLEYKSDEYYALATAITSENVGKDQLTLPPNKTIITEKQWKEQTGNMPKFNTGK
jgi:GLPGLI family protein